MEIQRYCGKERLPGGERLWRKLAKAAGFNGVLKVYGYGAAGEDRVVDGHRKFEKGEQDTVIIGLHTWWDGKPSQIQVWLPCKCQVTMDDWTKTRDAMLPKWLEDRYEPLFVFAHELGHQMQHNDGQKFDKSERGATRRGIKLLEKVCVREV